ncbi:MAG TPA: NAD-dependent epimerase/dehydratase family protein, partial [Caldimonas sp.]
MILLTGATGYIASHTWLALEAAGHRVAGIDDFSNSSPEVLRRLGALGADVSRFVAADVRDRAALERLFGTEKVDAVVHFAALK